MRSWKLEADHTLLPGHERRRLPRFRPFANLQGQAHVADRCKRILRRAAVPGITALLTGCVRAAA